MAVRALVLVVVAVLASACGAAAAPTPPPPTALADRTIAVVSMGSPDWLVAAHGSIWVHRDDGVVVRIDPATDAVVAEIDADVGDGELCQGLGADATSVWTCSGRDVVRIDPATNAVADVVPAGKIAVQGRLVVADGRVWVLTGANADRLVGIDVATREVSAPIDLGETCWDLAVAGGAVWAVCPPAKHVIRIDVAAGTVTDRLDGRGSVQIAGAADAIWGVGPDEVVRIGLEDHATLRVPIAVGDASLASIWAGPEGVWLRTAGTFLTRFDPVSARIVEILTAPDRGPGDVVGAGGSLWASDAADLDGAVIHVRLGG